MSDEASKTRPGSGLNPAGLRLWIPGPRRCYGWGCICGHLVVRACLEFVRACLEWGTGRPLAAGAAENEIANALLAIAQMAGLGRVVAAAPDVATALG